jgi:predicted DNA-binding transcriptional regulator AlpA
MPASATRRRAPSAGTRVIWPAGLEERLGLSPVTRWRWERAGKLPARDVHIGTRSGWRPETVEKLFSDAAVSAA